MALSAVVAVAAGASMLNVVAATTTAGTTTKVVAIVPAEVRIGIRTADRISPTSSMLPTTVVATSNSSHIKRTSPISAAVAASSSSHTATLGANTMTSLPRRVADGVADGVLTAVGLHTTIAHLAATATKGPVMGAEGEEATGATVEEVTATIKVVAATAREAITKVAAMVARLEETTATAATSRAMAMVRAAMVATAVAAATREAATTTVAAAVVDVIERRLSFMLRASWDWIYACSSL